MYWAGCSTSWPCDDSDNDNDDDDDDAHLLVEGGELGEGGVLTGPRGEGGLEHLEQLV